MASSGRRLRGRTRLRFLGWVFLVSLCLTLLAAWNTGANLLYIVSGGIGSFLVISGVLAGWSLRGLRVLREGPQAVHRGQPFPVTVRVENGKWLMPAVSLRIEKFALPGEAAGYVLKIPPRRSAVICVSETFDRRGVHPLPEIALVSAFPFGLIERRRRIQDAVEVVVYPRVVSVRTALLEQLPGANVLPRFVTGDGDEFFSLRDYIPGDDIRRVAWRVSARRGSLIVREMTRETSRFIVFVVDTGLRDDLPEFEQRFEDAIELVASLAVTLLNQQYTVSIATPAQTLPGGEGKTHARKALEMLARVTPVTEPRPRRGFSWFSPGEERGRASYAFISPDPREWGRRSPLGGSKVLDPREVVRA
jgi:uncharacterized protein (DUF58 family)